LKPVFLNKFELWPGPAPEWQGIFPDTSDITYFFYTDAFSILS